MVSKMPSPIRLKCETPQLQQPSAGKENIQISLDWDILNNIIGVFGDSGAGKTTLLRRIAGLTTSPNTDLSINQQDIDLHTRILNPCVYVGADTPLFEHLSLRRNLELTQRMSRWAGATSGERSLQARYGFHNCALLPLSDVVQLCELDSLLDKQASVLSSGEKQRGQIARALVSGKPILLLDEALSAMDWGLRTRLHLRLKRLCLDAGRAIVMVSHSLRELALMSDQLVKIDDGAVVREGATFTELRHMQGENDALFSTMLVNHVSNDPTHNLSIFTLQNTDAVIVAKLRDDAAFTDRLLIDASAVVLAKQSNIKSSMQNSLAGHIIKISSMQSSVSILLAVHGQHLIAQISKKSLLDMQLKEHDEIFALFKAN
jgi:molybdate transport system ATP-binding protein